MTREFDQHLRDRIDELDINPAWFVNVGGFKPCPAGMLILNKWKTVAGEKQPLYTGRVLQEPTVVVFISQKKLSLRLGSMIFPFKSPFSLGISKPAMFGDTRVGSTSMFLPR